MWTTLLLINQHRLYYGCWHGQGIIMDLDAKCIRLKDKAALRNKNELISAVCVLQPL